MKILVTGSSGLIGSSICNELKHSSNKIIKYDIKKKRKFNVESPKINKYLDNVNPDIIIHCAAHPGGLSNDYPIQNCKTNIIGSINLINWCSIKKKKFVFLSSSAVYEDSKKKLSENSKLNPKTIYGINKVACENYIKLLSSKHDFKWLILRLFATYGAGHAKNYYQGILNVIISQLKDRKNLIMKGSLNRKRDLISSTDAAKIIIKLTLSKKCNYTVNVGTGISTSISDLILLVKKNIKSKLLPNRIIVKKGTFGDPTSAVSNNKKLLKILKFYKFQKLEDGVKNTLRELKINKKL